MSDRQLVIGDEATLEEDVSKLLHDVAPGVLASMWTISKLCPTARTPAVRARATSRPPASRRGPVLCSACQRGAAASATQSASAPTFAGKVQSKSTRPWTSSPSPAIPAANGTPPQCVGRRSARAGVRRSRPGRARPERQGGRRPRPGPAGSRCAPAVSCGCGGRSSSAEDAAVTCPVQRVGRERAECLTPELEAVGAVRGDRAAAAGTGLGAAEG